MSDVFAKQIRHGGAKWRSSLCRRLGQILRETTGSGIDGELTALYFDLGRRKGRGLTASDVVDDPRGNQALHQAFCRLVQRRKDYPEIAGRLWIGINEDARSLYDDDATAWCLVHADQVTGFLDALEALGEAGLDDEQLPAGDAQSALDAS